MNTCPNSAELHRAITNSLEWQQRKREADMLIASGTVIPCLPVRISWWRRIWRWLA